MSDEIKPAPPAKPEPEPEESPTRELNLKERWLAGVPGVAAAGFGGWSVFVSENQAGTAALMIFATIFLVMAVQGTPIRRGGKDSFEMERRVRRAKVANKAEEVLDVEGPEKAEAFIEGASASDPGLATSEDLLAVRNEIYESRVLDQLHELINTRFHDTFDLVRHYRRNGFEFDAALRYRSDPEEEILIEIKTFTSVNRSLSGLYGGVAKLTRSGKPAIIIANLPMHRSRAIDYIQRLEGTQIQLVLWRTPLDNEELIAAIQRLVERRNAGD